MKISRRGIFEAAGAAAVGAAAFEIGAKYATPPSSTRYFPSARDPVTGANGQPAPMLSPSTMPSGPLYPDLPHALLICHGMMLFFYRNEPGEENYFYILVPNPYMTGNSNPVHRISLTEVSGDTNNILTHGGQLYRQGGYELQIQTANKNPYLRRDSKFSGTPDNGILPRAEEVVLYDSTGKRKIKPSTDIWNQYGGSPYKPSTNDAIWFSIKVPFPTFVFSFKGEQFDQGPAYEQTGVAKTLGVNPQSLPGMHVFYYENTDPKTQANLAYFDPTKPSPDSNLLAANANLKIHLYSQPPKKGQLSHLGLFNKMVEFDGSPLDLTDAKTKSTPLNNPPGSPIDRYLIDPPDYSELWEFLNPPSPPLLSADPVECLQGWGT
jgi:hypothetical protein